ncbi:LysR family transcriptional regulator [Lactiplantibacillus plajomi]|uniref:LysR family transcriptional regulator n=1 Tax=Lactiplantibacillus plajomi TaxID=1457217 RepID=A0ABV6K411_9LACO|nr:LysR family transcriptional regulator [Lactiplantibacillus plajomi]
MNTRDLALFRAVVKYRNYTHVAEKFAVSQPAVSQAIKRLERKFDAPLVKQDHAHQQMLITQAGKVLYHNSQAVQESLTLTHREIEAAKQPTIRLGMPPILGAMFFPQVAHQLLDWGWFQQLQVSEKGSARLLRDLKKGKLDVALVASAHPLHERGVQTIPLGSRPFEVIVSTVDPIAQRGSISFQELAEAKFIGLDDSFIHPRAFADYCHAAGVTPEVIYQTSDITWMKRSVEAGLGYGFLVQDAIHPGDGLRGLPISDPLREEFHVSVVYRDDMVLTQHDANLLQVLSKMEV